MAEICKATAPSRLLNVSKSAVLGCLLYSSVSSVVYSMGRVDCLTISASFFKLYLFVVLLTVLISSKCAPLTHSDNF